MKRAFILSLLLVSGFPTALLPDQKLTVANLSDFLARYDTNFDPLEAVFKDLCRFIA